MSADEATINSVLENRVCFEDCFYKKMKCRKCVCVYFLITEKSHLFLQRIKDGDSYHELLGSTEEFFRGIKKFHEKILRSCTSFVYFLIYIVSVILTSTL